MYKVFRSLFIVICLLIQLILVDILFFVLIDNIKIAGLIYSLYCLYFILKIIKNSKNDSITITWLIIFLMIPIPGSLLYIIIKRNIDKSMVIKNVIKEESESKKYLKGNDENTYSNSVEYIKKYSEFPISKNNDIKYYSFGDYALDDMLSDLKSAKKYIFMEYFIIKHGKMWNSILDVLKDKAKEGVEVRLMYDDFGCFYNLNHMYNKEIEKYGIKCIKFNELKAFGGVVMNHRDHRKILVIDGIVAYSGGINIADEYINIDSRFGKWKDNSFRLSGDAVWNYTVMFLTLWNSMNHEDDDYSVFKHKFNKKSNKGVVIPYGQNPLVKETVAEDIYLNLINQANEYLYIFTPYLIIDNHIINALTLAFKRGVDVRVIIPAIPDKKVVYTLSESYMSSLIERGIKVYKYKPGFVHSKVLISDERAIVGTINMDYRSLLLHFECGCYFENCDVLNDIKRDLTDTIKECHLVSKKETKVGYIKSFWQSVLRLFAPLM